MPFGLDKIIFFASICYISYKRKWTFLISKFKLEFAFLGLIFLYSLNRSFFSQYYGYAGYDFLLLVELIPCSYALYLLMSKNDKFSIDKAVVVNGIIASIFTLFLLLNPELNVQLKTNLLKYPEEVIKTFFYRGYGISDGLFFSYPIIQGFVMGFIILGIYKNKFNIVFISLLLLSIFSNARSGIFPVFIATIISLCISPKRTMMYVFAFLLLFQGIFVYFMDSNELFDNVFRWGMTSFDIAADFFHGEKTENMEYLLGAGIVLPHNLFGWLIGYGESFYIDGKRTTDIGYFLRLLYGGWIYCLLFAFLLFYMFNRMLSLNKIIAFLFFLSLIYLNYKGDFFTINSASRFFFLIYCCCILDNRLFKQVN
jgi:hypothetical protein